ncbi:MAG: hypothetical protein ACOWW1_07280 [archaeon]|nr:hypothetical protein [Candidatus Bathyarchaeum sp.]
MKIICDACWTCKNLDRRESTGEIPVCSLLVIGEQIKTEGICPDYKDVES